MRDYAVHDLTLIKLKDQLFGGTGFLVRYTKGYIK